MDLNDFNNFTHTDLNKMKITINNVIYELDKKDYEDNMLTGNTNMVLINGIIYMANDEDYKTLVEIENLMKLKEESDNSNGENLNE